LPSVVILRTLVPVVVGVVAFLASTARASASNPVQSFSTEVPLDLFVLTGQHITDTQSLSALLNFALMSKPIYERVKLVLDEHHRAYLELVADAGRIIEGELEVLSRQQGDIIGHIRAVTALGIREALANLDHFVHHTRTQVPLSLADGDGDVHTGFLVFVMNIASDLYDRKNSDDANLLDRIGFDARELFNNVLCPLMSAMTDTAQGQSSFSKDALLLLKPTWERVVGQSLEDQRSFVCGPRYEGTLPEFTARIKKHVQYLGRYVGTE